MEQKDGALAGMAFGCLDNLSTLNERVIIPVGRHKTAGTTGDASIPMTLTMYHQQFKCYLELVCTLLGCHNILGVPKSQVSTICYGSNSCI